MVYWYSTKGGRFMEKTDPRYGAYAEILREQLKSAQGCTEPISIAYAAALAKRALGCMPERARVLASGNIIKNAKSVSVPGTGGRKGIEAACAAGLIAGDADRELEVIARITQEERKGIEEYLAAGRVTTGLKPDARIFDILVTVEAGGHTASARIADRHTNVVELVNDGKSLTHQALGDEAGDDGPEAFLTVEGIYDFAATCDLTDVEGPIRRQMAANSRVAEEGLTGEWGACIGRVLMAREKEPCVRLRACAMAAAGSDARMSGCPLPVVINSGSGNQGLTVSLPVMEYAKA